MKPHFWLAAAIFFVPQIVIPTASAATSGGVRAPLRSDAPKVLNSKEKRQFRAIYNAIEASNWNEATKLINKADQGPMRFMATAELFLAPGSPRVDVGNLEKLLHAAPWLPQAAQLERLATKRGAMNLPRRPGTRRFSFLGESPRRQLPKPVNAPGADSLRRDINLSIRNDAPAEAEAKLNEQVGSLGADARTEMQHRVAWSYYIENDDVNAQRMGAVARKGVGDWAAQGAWAHGMASWRLKQYGAAFDAFDQVARRAGNDDMRAAGLFWSARAAMAAKRPEQVQPRLQSASQMPETFYGILASESLGMEPIARKQMRATKINWRELKRESNVQVAVGLSQIGENKLADETIKYQARIGDASKHGNLAELAGSLNLPSTQFWLGHYGPSRKDADALARYPMPNWKPARGWRVDPSLAFAHALQESQFRTSVVSPAGARGLMQIMPGTAKMLARTTGVNGSLNQPEVNLEYGQSYLEKLRDMPITGGLLPKVIAAYNAGPAPVSRWNSEVRDNGDPLLYIESIPYWETRGYVGIILRNYWIYEMRAGKSGGSMTGLAQYSWPKFPGSDGISLAVKNTGASLGN